VGTIGTLHQQKAELSNGWDSVNAAHDKEEDVLVLV